MTTTKQAGLLARIRNGKYFLMWQDSQGIAQFTMSPFTVRDADSIADVVVKANRIMLHLIDAGVDFDADYLLYVKDAKRDTVCTMIYDFGWTEFELEEVGVKYE